MAQSLFKKSGYSLGPTKSYNHLDYINLEDYSKPFKIPKDLYKWRVAPNTHPNSYDTIEWYREAIQAAIQGVTYRGYYYNPLVIWWLNFFVFPVPIRDKNGNYTEDFETSHPFFSNMDLYVLNVTWAAIKERKHVALMGGRGLGKSYLWTSILLWKYILFPESSVIVSATSSHHTDEAWVKVQDCLSAFERNHPMLAHKRLSDSGKLIQSGEVYYQEGLKKTRGYLSRIEKIIYGDNPGATRGRRPDIQLIEEFAAFPSSGPGRLENCIAQSTGSWKVMGGLNKCTVLYSGTGGTVNNDDAKNLFMNPDSYEVFPVYGWNGERPTGLFIPTHYKWAGTWEKDGVSDTEKAEKEVDDLREAQKDNPSKLTKFCQEFPKTLKEVFTKTGTNNFNQAKLAEQFVRFDFDEDLKNATYRASLNWIKAKDGRITGVKITRDFQGPFEIAEEPMKDEDGNPYNNLYVGGVDSIDQGNIDSVTTRGSKLALLIKKRIPDGAFFKSTQNVYVCKYVKRSDDVREDYENVLKATLLYNAKINVEYSKIGIVGYFRDQKQYHRLLKRPSIAIGKKDKESPIATNTNLIGTTTGPEVIDHQDSKIAEYIEDHCHQIVFQDLVAQLIDYKREDRTEYDLVIAMGLAELADEEFLGLLAKPAVSETKDLKMFGYYIDKDGYKQYGIIPDKPDADFQKGEPIGMGDTVTWVDKDGELKFDEYYGY
jgi:hypothetical protein